MITAAALLAGLAAALSCPGGTALTGREGAGGAWLTGTTARVRLVLAVSVLGGALWWLLNGTQLVLGLIALAVAAGVGRLVVRGREAVVADRRAQAVLGLCDAMAADLAAGQPPLRALERAAVEWPEFSSVASAGRLGADVPEALRGLAARPGAGQLRVLAAAWQVSHRSGAGLADAIRQAADAMRAEAATTRLVASELAAANATARMMALLPIGVLVLGSGVGGDPVGFLTGTPVGLGCLASGLAMSYAGLLWLQHIADGVLAR